MEFIFTIITLLTIVLSFTICPSFSNSQPIMVKSPQQQDHDFHELIVPALPRKLRLMEEANNVKAVETKNYVLPNKKEGSLSGKFHNKEGNLVVHAKKIGTWQEWKEEGADKSEFFTMDYSRLRRRRPIHNKFTPMAP